ncbi:AMP-binding protein [Pseudohaliea rubra]|uniref:Long-chain-fatty-acid--CoA ligase n=1 Tax=Pseudohaliea rubra DSM 19751 TaxID=1265313 RepID=A0A095X167_9GAMM|nr:AMP-binding protein [Pseudohaliea rubra]KGE04589.1 Long-chain-fatty-acid--CoA ligase [Pseudohaliea rubra DSM 19751]
MGRKKPDATYLRQPVNQVWREYSWRQVGDQARRIAAALQAMQLSPGDRVSILSRNCAHWLIADIGIMMGGFSSAPVFTTMSPDDVRYCLDHSGVRAMFVGQADNWKLVRKDLPPGVKIISLPDADVPDAHHNWDSLLKEHEPLAGNPDRAPDDEITTIFTSGSTGKPKGVVYSFDGARHIVRNIGQTFRLHEDDKFISYLPLAHGFERGAVGFMSLATGSSIGFNENQDTFGADMLEVRPTFFQCVPRLWSKFQESVLKSVGGQESLNSLLLEAKSAEATRKRIRQSLGLDRARVLLTGSAPTPLPLHVWFETLAMPLCEIYGQTEVLSGTCNLPWDRKPGTQGKPMVNTEVRIAEDGEILIKARAAMERYLHEPEKTVETVVDGWVHTGDKGELDGDGFLKLTGRVKEIFKTTKGKYVAPLPIESRFSANPNLEQLCLIGSGLSQTVLLVQLSAQGKAAEAEGLDLELAALTTETNRTLEKHARIAALIISKEDWCPENGLVTHTLKIKRAALEGRYRAMAEAVLADEGVSTNAPRVLRESGLQEL